MHYPPSTRFAGRPLLPLAIVLLLCTAGAAPARAQSSGTQASSGSKTDFLFGRPHGWVSVGGGWVFPRAEGDLFAFVSDQLTVDRSDYRAGLFTSGLGFTVLDQLDVVGDVEMSRHSIGSEYRDFVKADRTPIAQTTTLNQTTVGIGFRYSPLGRGREISNYAFLPRRIVPYVGAGASIVYSSFSQTGQFVDYVDLSIFNHVFRSTAWSAGPHVAGGADLQIWRVLFLNVAGRYAWVRSSLDADFVGFDGIDLAGFRGSTGISVVF